MPPPDFDFDARASALFELKRWNDVLSICADWLTAEPDSPGAHFHAAWAQMMLGDLRRAGGHVRSLLRVDGSSIQAQDTAAAWYIHRGRLRQARHHAEAALALAPLRAHQHFRLASILLRQGKLDLARASAERARELDPDNANIALIHIQAHHGTLSSKLDAVKVIARLEEALRLEPENATMLNLIGRVHLHELHDARTAEGFFRRALTLDPTNRAFQRDLFDAVAARQFPYRVLDLPGRVCRRLREYEPSCLEYVFGLLLIKLVAVAILWLSVSLVIYWPAARFYEILILSEISAAKRTNGIVVRALSRISFLPRWVRVTLLLAAVVGLWSLPSRALGFPVETGLRFVAGLTCGNVAMMLVCHAFHLVSVRAARWRHERHRRRLEPPPQKT